jgi:hypothetical protein
VGIDRNISSTRCPQGSQLQDFAPMKLRVRLRMPPLLHVSERCGHLRRRRLAASQIAERPVTVTIPFAAVSAVWALTPCEDWSRKSRELSEHESPGSPGTGPGTFRPL